MRIGIALVAIADLLIRAGDLAAHYTDHGIWPTHLIRNFGWNTGYWSLHAVNGNYAWELLLFCFHFMFAVFLLFGYKTRLSNLLVWLLTISLHNRNLFILQSGDDLLRLVLFWGLFLPWNSCYSLDARKKSFRTEQSVAANTGYLFLIASVYVFSVVLKTSMEWRGEGNAVYYALSLEQLRLPAGDWVYQFPVLMKWLTWLVFSLECIIPVLILWPSSKGTLRFAAFVCIVLLHLGIGITVYVGLFYVIGIVSGIGLLPKPVMDTLEITLKLKKKEAEGRLRKHNRFRPYTNSVIVVVIFLCLLVNLSTVSWFPYRLKNELDYPVNVLRLNQHWGMFSPSVLKKDGWFVYHGMDSLGRQWDLLRNEDYVDYAKPKHIVSRYKSDRWRKLAENMQNDTYTFLRPLYCKYILREWNKKHPEKKIPVLNLYYMEKESLPDYKTTLPVKKLYCVCDER